MLLREKVSVEAKRPERLQKHTKDPLGETLSRIGALIKNTPTAASENPFPVLRIARDGTILYANAAGAMTLLNRWNRHVGESAPGNWCGLIAEVFNSNRNKITDIRCDGHIFSFVLAPVTKGHYVNLYGRDITEQKKAEQEILRLNKKLEQRIAERTIKLTMTHKHLNKEIKERKSLEKEILRISEREKRLIGQELHDSIGQQFAGIAFMMKALEQRLAAKLPEEAANAAQIAKLVNEAMDQARGLAKGLHPVDLSSGSLKSALRELAATMERLFGIRCILKHNGSVVIDDVAVAVHIYRIIQEAITNAIKHGKTRNIQVKLTCGSGSNKSVLTVKNDGLDFPEVVTQNTGMGLRIIDHRVEMIGGSFDIRRSAEGGTILTCVFPNKKHRQTI